MYRWLPSKASGILPICLSHALICIALQSDLLLPEFIFHVLILRDLQEVTVVFVLYKNHERLILTASFAI